MADIQTKNCTICGEVKPIAEFGADSRSKTGRKARCLQCQRHINRKSYWKQPHLRRGSSLKWKNDNRSEHNRHVAERRARIKQQVFSAYGDKCSCCGEDRVGFLSLEHINGDGAADRRVHGNASQIYLKVIRAGFPSSYTILCLNCNFASRSGRVCPHKSHPLPSDRREVFTDLVKALEEIEYASRKDSLTDHERLQSVRTVVCGILSRVKGAPDHG